MPPFSWLLASGSCPCPWRPSSSLVVRMELASGSSGHRPESRTGAGRRRCKRPPERKHRVREPPPRTDERQGADRTTHRTGRCRAAVPPPPPQDGWEAGTGSTHTIQWFEWFRSTDPAWPNGSQMEPIWMIFLGRFGEPVGRTDPPPSWVYIYTKKSTLLLRTSVKIRFRPSTLKPDRKVPQFLRTSFLGCFFSSGCYSKRGFVFFSFLIYFG